MIKLNTEYLKQIFTKYDYIMTTAQLNLEKLYYRDIQQMLKKGMIEKVKRGYYHWIEDNDCKEVVIINKLFPDAILCMETALFYYSYSDRNPADLLLIGETKGEIDFTPVRIYDRDRTMCAVLKNMNKMDREIFNKSIQGYVKDPQKNIPNLMRYAKELRVQKRVKDLIGVWL